MAAWKTLIDRAASKVLVDINLKCYEIAWYLFTKVVEFSPSPDNPGPTAKGVLANQWYPQAGSASYAHTSARSPNGAGSLARINAMMGGTEFYLRDGKLVLSNSTEYIMLAEAEGWKPPVWSGRTGPYRMVARGLQATRAKYKKVKI